MWPGLLIKALISGHAAPESPPEPDVPPPICVWITARDRHIVRSIADAVAGGLMGHSGPVVVLPQRPGEFAGTFEGPRREAIARISHEASTHLSEGTTTVVGFALVGEAESRLARSIVGPIIEVHLRSAEEGLGPSEVPTIYRTIQEGRVVEREADARSLGAPDAPQILVEGPLGAPEEVALGLVDTLRRGGWLSAVGHRSSEETEASPLGLPP